MKEIIVLANNEQDIVSTLLFSKNHCLDFAVSSGGHFFGDANSSEGVVIDLRDFSAVEVDPQSKTLKAQGGAKWFAVDKAASEHGLAAVAGGAQTGIGGVTLGGGYGLLTGAHGLALDNLLAARIVLADGRVVNASENENEDLFWALRGAGPSFGIVVEFTFKLHDQKTDVWAGALGFPLPKAVEIFRFAGSAIPTGNGRAAMTVLLCNPPPAFKPIFVVSIFYNGPASSAKDFFKSLYDLGPLFDGTKEIPYHVANGLAKQPPLPGTRRVMYGAIFPTSFDPDSFQDIIDRYVNFITVVPTGATAVIAWEFHDLSRVLAVPDSVTSFPNRGNYRNVMIQAGWKDQELDQMCRDWVLGIGEKFRASFESHGISETGSNGGSGYYTNYDSKSKSSSYTRLRWRNTSIVLSSANLSHRLHHSRFKGIWSSLRQTCRVENEVRSRQCFCQVV